jgi:hypothetical protein
METWISNNSTGIGSQSILGSTVAGSNGGYAMYGLGQNVVSAQVYNSGGGYKLTNDSVLRQKDEWNHFVAVYDSTATTLKIYVNGVLIKTDTGAWTQAASAGNFVLGRSPHTSGSFMNARLDEVRVANSVMNASTVKANYLTQVDAFVGYGRVETNSGQPTISITLDRTSPFNVTIPYTVSGTSGSTDHTLTSGNLVIPAGDSSGSINLNIFKDALDSEGSESLIVTMGSPTNGLQGTTTVHTLTLTDDTNIVPSASNDALTVTSVMRNEGHAIYPLANDGDTNNDQVLISSITSPPTSGTVVNLGRSLIYFPNDLFNGTDSIGYQISDGRGGTASATVSISFSVPYTWLGASSNIWSAATNWRGGAVPTSTTRVFFNDQCTNCNPALAANTTVYGIRMASGFAGSLNQGAYNLTSGQAGFYQAGGTLNGGSGTTELQHTVSIAGGTFNASSGSTNINSLFGNLSVTPASFNAGSGTFVLQYTSSYEDIMYANITGTTFNNFKMSGYGQYYNLNNSTITVNGTLTCDAISSPSIFTDGTISAKGNVVLTNTGCNGTGHFDISGTGAQTVAATGSTYSLPVLGNVSYAPALDLNNSGGSITLSGSIVAGGFSYNGGTATADSTSTIIINKSTTISPNGFHFYNFGGDLWGSYVINLNNQSLYVDNKMYCSINSSNGTSFTRGNVYVYGDISINGYGCTEEALTTNSVTIELAGSNNQIVDSSNAVSASGAISGLKINKTGGSVTLNGANLRINREFTYVNAGSVVTTGSTVTLGSNYSNALTINPGSFVFENFKVSSYNSALYLYSNLYVNGDFTCASSSASTWNNMGGGYSLNVNGNLSFTSGGCNGSVPLNLTKAGTISVSHASGSGGVPRGTWTVNGGGTLSLASALNLGYTGINLSITSGSILMNGYALTVGTISGGALSLNGNTCTKGGGTLTSGGSVQGTGSLLGGTVN